MSGHAGLLPLRYSEQILLYIEPTHERSNGWSTCSSGHTQTDISLFKLDQLFLDPALVQLQLQPTPLALALTLSFTWSLASTIQIASDRY